ncbi:Na+/H+ antiporter subunit E [Nesterenkonia sp. MY13]|uniref:Na+/H+ antiporter subunit E n=1 Tax=Nesterenkonia sedimenti TaxID=1463632 RepID=A0A7X8TJB3_9MICC|nr:Na+/H+ antiporter subunit E [Nesterenkonia sedimenti]NLS09377.1 Na+/H+ antiporter subunit E [Nesterenkonia sedimenti]
MRRPRTPLKLELPLILFLGVFWMAVWQSFDLGTFIIGVVYGTIAVRVFYLPPLRGTGRINPIWLLVLVLRFLGKMVYASFQVSWIILVKGPRVRNSIISIQLRSHDDLMITLVTHHLGLVPGSVLLDVDRTTATLYLHALNVTDDYRAEKIRQDALRTEALLIRALGNRSDLAVIKAERRLGRMAGFSKTERESPIPAHSNAPAAGLTSGRTKGGGKTS